MFATKYIQRLLVVVLFVGCFDPQLQQGVPCTSDGRCPLDQICAFDNRCYDPDDVPEPNRDSTLAALELSAGALEPAFDPAITTYSVSLGLGPEALLLTPTAGVPDGVAITIGEVPVESGAASDPILLALGPNSLAILVDAQDGRSTTYEIEVDRGADLL